MINLNSSNSLVVGALKFVCEKEGDSDDWKFSELPKLCH